MERNDSAVSTAGRMRRHMGHIKFMRSNSRKIINACKCSQNLLILPNILGWLKTSNVPNYYFERVQYRIKAAVFLGTINLLKFLLQINHTIRLCLTLWPRNKIWNAIAKNGKIRFNFEKIVEFERKTFEKIVRAKIILDQRQESVALINYGSKTEIKYPAENLFNGKFRCRNKLDKKNEKHLKSLVYVAIALVYVHLVGFLVLGAKVPGPIPAELIFLLLDIIAIGSLAFFVISYNEYDVKMTDTRDKSEKNMRSRAISRSPHKRSHIFLDKTISKIKLL